VAARTLPVIDAHWRCLWCSSRCAIHCSPRFHDRIENFDFGLGQGGIVTGIHGLENSALLLIQSRFVCRTVPLFSFRLRRGRSTMTFEW
jgi:hypothetical protein